MLGPVSRSRLGLQNVCASCLVTLLRRNLARTQCRSLNSTTTERTNEVPDIISTQGSGSPEPSTSEIKTFSDVFPTLDRSLSEKQEGSSQPSKTNGKVRKSGKKSSKTEHETIADNPLRSQVDQYARAKKNDAQESKTSVKLASLASKTRTRPTAGATPSRVPKSAEATESGSPTSKKKKKKSPAQKVPSSDVETVKATKNSVVSPLPQSEFLNKKPKQNTIMPTIRRTHPEAKTPDMQRLIAKTHILRLNQQGGLSDADKLQIMEHFRRSMEDKALAEVVSFTKRRNTSKSASKFTSTINFMSNKSPTSQKASSALEKEEDQTPGSLKPFKPLGPPKSDPAIQPIKKSSSLTAYDIQTIEANKLNLVPLDVPQPPVPKLSYGLERVLFNPGVYHLRDPRSRVFNFDPYLQSIMPIRDFDFSALKEYITSSRDKTLISTAAAEGKKYSGSTSSMTSALAHFHFLLSQWRPISTSTLSQGFTAEYQTFTTLQRAPSAIFLRWRNGTYAIDADKQFDTANILMMLGKSMEKLLTLPTEDFEKYRKENSSKLSEEERNEAESYHYTTMGDFLMRSQLDAFDPRLPGTGMFDLKTRAVVSIRMDAQNYENGLGYEIRGRHGEFESYEREYYDMIRSAFLKYSLQVRMGRMDGIFVAFHNTERIFGFQYISLPEMDFALHGTDDTTLGDTEFKTSLELLNRVLDRATAKYPERSLRLHFETREGVAPFMYIFAEPLSETEIDEIQTTNQAEVAEFERRALGLKHDKIDDEASSEWGNLQAKVEKTMERDELGVDDQFEDSQDIGDAEAITISVEHDEVEMRVHELLSGITIDRTKEVEDDEEEMESDEEQDGHEEEDGYEYPRTRHNLTDQHGIFEASDDVVDKVAVRYDAEGGLTQNESEPTGEFFYTETGMGDEENNREGSESETPESAPDMETKHPSQVDTNNATEAHTANVPELGVAATESTTKDPTELLAMTLTIRNKVNGRYVTRPANFTSDDDWDVEYALAEIPQMEKALTLYKASQKRRAASLQNKSVETNKWVNSYLSNLHDLSKKGRQWRKSQDEIDEIEPYKVLPQSPIQ